MSKKFTLLLSALAVALLLTACNSSDYKKAATAFTEGNYEEAVAIFDALGDYKDSAAQAVECRYQIADGIFAGEDYEKALEAFTELGEYKDSADKITECKYCIADDKLSESDFEGALFDFEKLGDYKDSVEKITECRYGIAGEKLSSGSYREAIKDFTELGDYKDAAALIAEATDKLIAEELPGTYDSETLDLTELFVTSVAGALSEDGMDMEGLLDDVQVRMNVTATFTEDGKVTEAVDKDTFMADLTAVTEKLEEGLTEYFADMMEKEFEAQGISMDLVYALFGVENIGDLLESVAGINIADLLNEVLVAAFEDVPMDKEGTYVIENGVITATDVDGETEVFTWNMETGDLTVDAEDVPEEYKAFYPITFTKHK